MFGGSESWQHKQLNREQVDKRMIRIFSQSEEKQDYEEENVDYNKHAYKRTTGLTRAVLPGTITIRCLRMMVNELTKNIPPSLYSKSTNKIIFKLLINNFRITNIFYKCVY